MQVEVLNQEERIGRNSSEKAAKSVQLASMSRKSANWQLWAEKVQTGQDGCYGTGHEKEGLAWNNQLLKRGKIVISHEEAALEIRASHPINRS